MSVYLERPVRDLSVAFDRHAKTFMGILDRVASVSEAVLGVARDTSSSLAALAAAQTRIAAAMEAQARTAANSGAYPASGDLVFHFYGNCAQDGHGIVVNAMADSMISYKWIDGTMINAHISTFSPVTMDDGPSILSYSTNKNLWKVKR